MELGILEEGNKNPASALHVFCLLEPVVSVAGYACTSSIPEV